MITRLLLLLPLLICACSETATQDPLQIEPICQEGVAGPDATCINPETCDKRSECLVGFYCFNEICEPVVPCETDSDCPDGICESLACVDYYVIDPKNNAKSCEDPVDCEDDAKTLKSAGRAGGILCSVDVDTYVVDVPQARYLAETWIEISIKSGAKAEILHRAPGANWKPIEMGRVGKTRFAVSSGQHEIRFLGNPKTCGVEHSVSFGEN